MTESRDSNPASPRAIVADALQEDILASRLALGGHLREVDLAERFGVWRIPVRNALSQLQGEGFVALIRYRKATVPAPSGSARDLVQIRQGLEVLAAQLAARNRGRGGRRAGAGRAELMLGQSSVAAGQRNATPSWRQVRTCGISVGAPQPHLHVVVP